MYECQISTQPVRSFFVHLDVVGELAKCFLLFAFASKAMFIYIIRIYRRVYVVGNYRYIMYSMYDFNINLSLPIPPALIFHLLLG